MFSGVCTQSFAQSTTVCEVITEQEYSAGKVNISSLSFSKISAQVYTGKQIKPKITVKKGSTTLTKGKDYSVTYKNNKNIGTASVIIKGLGNYTGSKKISFKIKPAAPKASISAKNGVATLSWGKVRGAGGYQIYFSQNGGEYSKLASTASTSYSIPGLDRQDNYSFKVRAYKKVNGKSVYGSFSKAVSLAPSNGALPDDGDTFTVVTYSSGYTDLINSFAKENNIKANIITLDYEISQSVQEYYNYLTTLRDADILIVDSDLIYEVINDGRVCVPLSDIGLSKSDFPQAFDYTLSNGTNEKGELSATGLTACAGGFVYRADLAKKYLGVNSPEEMQKLIKDWDSFTKTAAKLYEKSNGKVALLDSVGGGAYNALLCSYNESWVNNGKLNTAKAENIINYVDMLLENGYATRVCPWEGEWFAALSNGNALGEFLPTWAVYENDYCVAAQMADGCELALCEGPAAYYWGGSYACVAQKCDNATLAKKFLDYCSNDYDCLSDMVKSDGFVNNKKVMQDAYASISYLGGQNPYKIFLSVLDDMDKSFAKTKYDAKIDSYLSSAIWSLIWGYGDKEAALYEFKYYVSSSFPELKVS